MHGPDAPWLDFRSLGTAPCTLAGAGEPASSCRPVTTAITGSDRRPVAFLAGRAPNAITIARYSQDRAVQLGADQAFGVRLHHA